MLTELDSIPHSVLFIDEIHAAIGAGATSGGAMDAANLLKPALASGNLRCIGSTTYKEYRNYFEKDRALVRRFQKIDVNEPSQSDSVKILRGLKPYYEKHHGVRYTASAIRAAVELSARYITDRRLPDKALDVIDEAGASQMLLAENKRRKKITVKDVERIVAGIARIPPKSVTKDDKESLRNLDRDLKTMVYGQDEAIEILAEGRGPVVSVATMQSIAPWHEVGQATPAHIDASQCMGSASSIGLGLAIARPDRKVMVLDGDGSLLMQLGSLVTVASVQPKNLYHFVFANGLHQSTGNQPLPGQGLFSWTNLAKASGYQLSLIHICRCRRAI